MSISKSKSNRRKFLGDCGKMSSVGALASGLVCVYLGGGNDSFNMLMPANNSRFAEYTARRGRIALNRNNLHFLNDRIAGNPNFLLHNSMPGVAGMFADNDLAFLANVGTLIEPLTRTQFQQNTRRRPFGLFSHNDQARQWQSSIHDERSSVGWVGRMTDILNDAANNNATLNVALAPGGNNVLQAGRETVPFNVAGGANRFDRYENNGNVRNAMNATLAESNYNHVLEQHYNSVRAESIEQNEFLIEVETTTPINTPFPNTGLGRQLRQVAQYIARAQDFGANRQNFFVQRGGWDHHSGNTVADHANLLRELSEALTAFNSAMKEIGRHDNVVTYTASDFGRTLSPNGRGTDHGWGGNQMLMGGPVGGGRVFGDYPSLVAGSATDVGRGRVLPTTSVAQMHATIARWYGITNSEMPLVIPDVGNFNNNGFIKGLI